MGLIALIFYAVVDILILQELMGRYWYLYLAVHEVVYSRGVRCNDVWS